MSHQNELTKVILLYLTYGPFIAVHGLICRIIRRQVKLVHRRLFRRQEIRRHAAHTQSREGDGEKSITRSPEKKLTLSDFESKSLGILEGFLLGGWLSPQVLSGTLYGGLGASFVKSFESCPHGVATHGCATRDNGCTRGCTHACTHGVATHGCTHG